MSHGPSLRIMYQISHRSRRGFCLLKETLGATNWLVQTRASTKLCAGEFRDSQKSCNTAGARAGKHGCFRNSNVMRQLIRREHSNGLGSNCFAVACRAGRRSRIASSDSQPRVCARPDRSGYRCHGVAFLLCRRCKVRTDIRSLQHRL
jgi:hypothetical protein